MKDKLFLKVLVLSLVLLFSFNVSGAYVSNDFDNHSFESTSFSDWNVNTWEDTSAIDGYSTFGNYSPLGTADVNATVETGIASVGDYYAFISTNLQAQYYGGVCAGITFQNDLNFLIESGDKLKFDLYSDNGSYNGKVRAFLKIKGVNGNYFWTSYNGGESISCNDSPESLDYPDWEAFESDGVGSWNTKTYIFPECVNTFQGGMDSSYKPELLITQCVTTSDSSDWQFRLDNFIFEKKSALDLVNTLVAPVTTINAGEQFTIRVSVAFDSNSENVSNADVNFNFRNLGWFPSEYSEANNWYEATISAPDSSGDYNIAVESFLTDVNGDYDEYSITVIKPESSYLTITPIENILSWSFGSVDFIPNDESESIIWKVESSSETVEIPNYNIVNSLTDGRQYFIYTSSDGVNYPFDDTLTYGSGYTNPIQKLWNELTEQYDYNFSDTLSSLETKYYKLTYKNPYKSYNSLSGSTDWQITFNPNVIDLNSVQYDSYPTSQYSTIRNTFIENIPSITGGDTNSFEVQFTAWSSLTNTYICVGDTVYNSDSEECEYLTSTPVRYSFPVNASEWDSQILIISGNEEGKADVINIMDYAIIPRNYFTNRLSLLKANGNVLDSFLIGSLSYQYLQEGTNFKLKTGVYDREGLIDRVEIEGYFGDTTAINQVSESFFYPYELDDDADDKEESFLNFSQNFEPIIDLSGTGTDPATPRVLILKANLYDTNGVNVSIQSKTIRFIQYPYFPNDLKLNFFPTEKRQGKHPKGILEVIVKDSGTLTGFDIRIWDDTNSATTPDYKTRIYNGTDFTCISSDCSLQMYIDEWIFEDINRVSIQVTAIMNTEFFSLDNDLTNVLRHVWVTPIEFNIGKIHQVIERPDNAYRNDEQINLVLVLQDDEATNLENKIDISLNLLNCDSNNVATANCVTQTTDYKPTGFIYDDKFNLNYYFFNHLYILDSGDLLPDGNFISFNSTVTGLQGIRTASTPILASKCKGKDWIAEYVDLAIGFLPSIIADPLKAVTSYCVTEQYDLVTTTANNTEREYLRIDSGKSTTSPTQEALLCLSPDSNNVLSKPFEQNLICYVAYTVGEKPIDSFRFRVTNNFSDLTNEDSTKQYMQFDIPNEVIAYNDPMLLKAELELNQNSKITTVGDYLYFGFRNLAVTNFKFWGLEDATNFALGNGLIENFGGEIDLTADFNVANVPAGMFIVVKGIPVLNVQSYKNDTRLSEAFDGISRNNFLNYLAENNIPFKAGEGELRVVTSNFTSPFIIKSDGVLIIDAVAEEIEINRSNVDANTSINYDVMPQAFIFTLSNTMFYNNFSENDTLTTMIRVMSVITNPPLQSIIDFITDFSEDPPKATTSFLFKNIIFIVILMGLMLVLAIMYSKFKPNGVA